MYRYFTIIIFFVFYHQSIRSDVFKTCSKKIHRITFYSVSPYIHFYKNMGIEDIMSYVDQSQNDFKTRTKTIINDTNSINYLDSVIKSNRGMSKIIYSPKNLKLKKECNMNIRHVFKIEFNDTSKLFIGLFPGSKKMCINGRRNRKNDKLVFNLYQQIENQNDN